MKTLSPPPFSVRVNDEKEWNKIAPMLEAALCYWQNGMYPGMFTPKTFPCYVNCDEEMFLTYNNTEAKFDLTQLIPHFHLTHPSDLIPAYQTSGSAGFDICSDQDIWIKSGKQEAVKTGLYIHNMPSDQFLGIYSRSGLVLKHRVSVANAPGAVDSDFPGEILVILRNDGTDDFHVKRGDRIAQGIVHTIVRPGSIAILQNERTDGFGHTG